MYLDAEERKKDLMDQNNVKDGYMFKVTDDPRIIKGVGNFIRNYSIDEFPQFLNVLLGHMSLIGPRPTLPGARIEVSEMDEIRQKRYSVRPGITGYAQAYYRNSITQDEKFKYDAFYADNITFLMDLKIIFKTVLSVIKKENINTADSMKTAVHTEEKEKAGNCFYESSGL